MATTAVSLGGCNLSGNDTSALSLQAEPTVRVSSVALEAISPGIIPTSSFEKLRRNGRNAALRAEFKALEEAPPNVPIAWADGTKANGEVRAATPYKVGATTCRPYAHSGNIDGQPFSARGTACRSVTGIWEPIS